MFVIIPINGLGTRFAQDNYTFPKPLINVLGKRMIFWVIDSLKLDINHTLVIPYSDQLDKFNFRDIVQDQYPNLDIRFIPIDRPTKGAAETLLVAINELGEVDNMPTLVVDCDTFYEDDIVGNFQNHPRNVIYYFEDEGKDPLFSYHSVGEDGYVVTIQEKVRISNRASTGAYGFDSVEGLKKACEQVLGNNYLLTGNEYYVSAVYRWMIDQGFYVEAQYVDKFHCVGTPLQLKVFCETYNQAPKRFCFDLDSTLVTKPRVEGDYSTVEPIEKNITLLRYLKQAGHTIIVYTARRMRTHKGNVGAIVADVGKLTMDTLEKFDIPYDELNFGKPWADFYIDDLAVDCNTDIEKSIGYYNTMTKPRDFNTIEISDNQVTKTGNVDGEIFFYNAIQQYPFIKDLFPKLISSSNDTLTIERVNGVTFSYLFQNNSLQPAVFKQMLSNLMAVHNTPVAGVKEAAVGSMLLWQFEDRIKGFDYSKYPGGPDLTKRVLRFMDGYEFDREIEPCIIHGDPVFSNILHDTNLDIKFIDMRGKLSNTHTILGDPCYDLAKIYQSLMGYDFVLNDRRIVRNTELIDIFEQHVTKNYGLSMKIIKQMTGCLYVSLVPLHDNDKCVKYLELGKKLLEE